MNIVISGERSVRKSATFDQRMLEDSMSNADEQTPGKASGTARQNLHHPSLSGENTSQ